MLRLIVGAWLVLHALWSRRIFPRIAWALGYLKTNRQTISSWPEPAARAGETPLGPNVVVFVHFDGGGAVRRHVMNYLRALRDAGADIAFVTNSGRLRPDALEQLKTVCAAVLIRRNVGYDFGAWHDGMATLALPRQNTERLYLVNDSVYGPLGALDGIVGRMDFEAADLWGMTESWQGRFHLQSYFLAAGPAAFRHPAWADFWSSVRPAPSKHWIVHKYEIGLSQALLKAGLRLRALWTYADLTRDIDPELLMEPDKDERQSFDPALKARRAQALSIRKLIVRRVPLNPTSDLWRQLLDAGYPFIKRELLRLNPTEVEDVAEWRAKLALMNIETGAIEEDLQRSLRHKSP
jgi:lipopolysaccharide biosynthesis protein